MFLLLNRDSERPQTPPHESLATLFLSKGPHFPFIKDTCFNLFLSGHDGHALQATLKVLFFYIGIPLSKGICYTGVPRLCAESV